MKTQFQDQTHHESKTVSLNRIVARLAAQWQPIAVEQSSFILNDVPRDFYLKTDSIVLTKIIAALLNSVISRTANSCIHVSAKRFNDIVILRFKDSHPPAYRFSQYDWQKINSLVEKIGGCIIEDDSIKNNSVTLSFYSLSVAA